MLTISDIATKYLDTWHDKFMRGQLQIWELPLPIQAFYHSGYFDGLSSNHQTAQIAQLEHECDRLYLAAFSPKERKAILTKQHNERHEIEWELMESRLLELIYKSFGGADTSAEVEQPNGLNNKQNVA